MSALSRVAWTIGLGLALALAACSSGGSQAGRAPTVAAPAGSGSAPRPTTTGAPPLYVAVGASETTGVGAEQPLRDAWPRVLYRTAMPENTVFVNMGIPGATVAQALRDEVPQAVAQKPTIVTVWLNVNDLIAGVSAADFETELGDLVHQLRRGGATRVLVANTPPLDHLPAYVACLPDPPPASPPCRVGPGAAGILPPPAVLNQAVDDYNAATARVAQREGASVVDLHAVGMAARQAGIEDALVSPDGFHPNTGGYQAVATAFADVLRRTGPL
jgi:acyl-CoA thioesterase-1